MRLQCPECRSDDVIEYADGWLCRDCGCEFNDPDDRPAAEEEE